MGLLPKGITQFDYDDTGRFEVHLDQACNAKFESELRYDRNVSGTLTYGEIGELSGISAQELFLWFPVKGIRVDVPSSGLIYFDVGVVFKQFSLSLFETPRDCIAVRECAGLCQGHTEPVLSVAISPDGRHLASGLGDTTVRLWDLNTQTPMFTCTGHKNWVLSIAWSPDGKHLVSGSKSGELQCWDPHSRKPTGNPLNGHKKWNTGIFWEPVHLNAPRRRIVSASKDGDARIWDVSLKKCVICLSGHTLAVTCVKWGGDGVIYTGSQDCTIKVWETSQGKLIRELKGHGHWVNSLALSTEYVLRTGAFDPTGKEYSSSEEMKKVALEEYNKMKGNAPERLVSGSDDFTMFLWEPSVSKHHKVHMTGHQQVFAVDSSPDGEKVASGGKDRVLKLWMG
ncbi:hypothetical protein COLO4_04880 [Corchorus olitorius]|uniref:Uncharacterized protein n=1 Tax=Corchorus olitorius TaxID=93759 RepID=A0A1R3KSJ2_9ROSI|nr:hypothetical protein COLO4_04880 [Corchorus olitorius]